MSFHKLLTPNNQRNDKKVHSLQLPVKKEAGIQRRRSVLGEISKKEALIEAENEREKKKTPWGSKFVISQKNVQLQLWMLA
mmetsp:Transcript_31113/g.47539  ORF Transcript_31113/g.47539 Transcript_31113/m.47539 type:complete len:81 (-) Transcript_31113:2811-3053(-)